MLDRITEADAVTLSIEDPTGDAGGEAIVRFFTEILRRSPTPVVDEAGIARVLAAEPSDDLRGTGGFLLVARAGDAIVGCAGVRVVADAEDLGEVTRVFVDASQRGRGTGGLLLRSLEQLSVERGLRRLRLTVRDDLVEARRLYERLGYRPIPRFSDDPYAHRFLGKDVAPAA